MPNGRQFSPPGRHPTARAPACLADLPASSVMSELAKRWQELSEDDRKVRTAA